MSETVAQPALTPAEIDLVRYYCGYPAEEAMPVIYVPPPGIVTISERLDLLTLAPIPLQNAGLRGRSTMLDAIINTLSTERLARIRTYFLPNLQLLEADIPGVRNNLDTDKADVWSRNRTEQQDRIALYDTLRQQLCRYLGVPMGEGIGPAVTAAFVV